MRLTFHTTWLRLAVEVFEPEQAVDTSSTLLNLADCADQSIADDAGDGTYSYDEGIGPYEERRLPFGFGR